jgi:hypothetical protein
MAPRIDDKRVRDLALELPNTEERPSYGTPGFRVRGKLFARLLPDESSLVLRCGFERRAALLQEEDDIFYITPHYAAWPWVVSRLDKIGLKRLREAIKEAWQVASEEAVEKAARSRRVGRPR